MIVLDEHLDGLGLDTAIARWYPGKAANVKVLRARSIIKDDAVPMLLRQTKQATFLSLSTRWIFGKNSLRIDAFVLFSIDS